MRVLILANNDVGLFKFRKELIERLILDGHKVFIALPTGDFIPQLKKIGCIFINTNIDRRGVNPIKDMQLFLSYIRLLNRIKPNIVFTYTIKPNIYGGMACSLRKIPYVVNITGLGTAVEKRGFLQHPPRVGAPLPRTGGLVHRGRIGGLAGHHRRHFFYKY